MEIEKGKGKRKGKGEGEGKGRKEGGEGKGGERREGKERFKKKYHFATFFVAEKGVFISFGNSIIFTFTQHLNIKI